MLNTPRFAAEREDGPVFPPDRGTCSGGSLSLFLPLDGSLRYVNYEAILCGLPMITSLEDVTDGQEFQARVSWPLLARA
jgi:hypothetical protein